MANFMDPNLPMLPRQNQNSAMTLADLMRSGKTPEEINAILSGSTVGSGTLDPNFMAGEPYMPPQQTQPMNSLVNMRTGREVPLLDAMGRPSQSQAQGPAVDFTQGPVDTLSGRGYYMKGDNTRVVLGDGRIVDLGRDTGRERAMMKENLALEKTRAEIDQMKAKPGSASEAAMAKMLAEIQSEKMKAQIPGTAEYERVQKRDAGVKKEESAWQGSIRQAEDMTGYIDSILGEGQYKDKGSKLGFFSTGLPGQVLQNVGGTDARNLRGDIDRIKANIGFEELNKMRRESPTGGALGQVTERELQFLQSVQGSLDQAQTPEQLERMLNDIKLSTARLKNDLLKNPPKGFSGGGAPAKSGAEQQAMLMKEAQDAIASGAPRDAVMQRLQEKLGVR